MTRQEENWELLTVLGFPWSECEKIDGEDRKFLLNKAVEVREQVQKQQELEMQLEAEAFKERLAANPPGDGGNPSREDRGLEAPQMQLPGNL